MTDVYVQQGGAPAQMAYDAISSVFSEDPSALSVLLKVNTGFQGPAASGLCTHPEVVRGLIRFFKEKRTKKLYVGDSSIVGVDSTEALKSAGIWAVCQEEGVECLNLDESGMTEQEIPDPIMVSRLKMSRLPFQVDRVISVPVMKTHMYAGVTLSIKNMKGCLFQKDKTRLHRIHQAPPDLRKGKCLDYGIVDLMKVCYPDYAVIDGVVAMEGFGPSGGTPGGAWSRALFPGCSRGRSHRHPPDGHGGRRRAAPESDAGTAESGPFGYPRLSCGLPEVVPAVPAGLRA